MDMLLAAGILVLVSGERGTSGEYILMDSEVNRLLFIVMLFLCVSGILIGVLHYVHVESNGFLCDGTAGEYVGNLLDNRLEIAGNGWSALKLCMEPWWCNSFRRHSCQCVGRETRQSVMSWVETSVTLHASHVPSYKWQTASLG